MQDAVLIGAIVLPIVLLLALKSHAAIVFLSLCAGAVLVQYVGNNASTAVTAFSPGNRELLDSITRIVILLTPVITSMVVLRGAMPGSKIAVNLLPAVALGLASTLLTVPLLPGGLEAQLKRAPVWSDLQSFQDFIVAVGAVVSLAVLWISHKSPHSKKGKGH